MSEETCKMAQEQFQSVYTEAVTLNLLALIVTVPWCHINLLVALFDYFIIVLPVLTSARSFIMLNTMIKNKSKSYTTILMSFLKS